MLIKLPKKKHLIHFQVLANLKTKYHMATSRKAHYASVVKHQSTSSLWKTGSGIIDSKTLTIILWNVNGFRSVLQKGELSNLLTKYSQQADLICLNETKIDYQSYLKETKSNKLTIENSVSFNEYWNFCKVSSGYSGVMTFSKHLPLSVTEDMPEFESHNKEGRIITLEFEKFYIINLYKPNAGDMLVRLEYRLEYEQCLRSFIKKLQEKKPVIIVGDMNVANDEIDLKNPKLNEGKACFTKEQRQKFKQMLKECNLIDSFRHLHPTTTKYSFWSYRTRAREKNVGWRLDYVLVDKRLKVHEADIMNDVYGSDHCPVIAKIEFS